MTVVGVLGAGQLGRMLALAGYPLGLRFAFFDENAEAPAGHLGALTVANWDDRAALDAFANTVDLVTYEFENVPVETKTLKGMDSLLSIVQMPAGVPVGTLAIGKAGATNAALLAAAILGAKYPEIRLALKRFRAAQTEKVLASPDPREDGEAPPKP